MTCIRHGESEANVLDIWGGDYPLTPTGRVQALMVPRENPEMIVISGLVRTRETAELVYPGHSFTVDETFREIDFGRLENERIDFNGEAFWAFIERPGSFHGISGGDDIEARARRALRRMRDYPEGTVFFTHGTLMQAMRSLTVYGTIEVMHKMRRIGNCERWDVESYNDILRTGK